MPWKSLDLAFFRIYKPNHTIRNTIAVSDTAKKIHVPMPLLLKKSGIPIKVKVLKRVAAKVKIPKTEPTFDPANK